jgi:hypothetical protein
MSALLGELIRQYLRDPKRSPLVQAVQPKATAKRRT